MSDTRHVMPIDDWVDHESNEDCSCIPECRPIERDDGGFNWMYVHHAWDGRE